MILDFARFTKRGFMVDHVHPENPRGGRGTKHGKRRECKTRKGAVEDREFTDLSTTAK